MLFVEHAHCDKIDADQSESTRLAPMDKHKEITIEEGLVAHLTAHGWLEGDPAHYDRALALYPDDLIGWLQETQPQQWAKLTAQNKGDLTRCVGACRQPAGPGWRAGAAAPRLQGSQCPL